VHDLGQFRILALFSIEHVQPVRIRVFPAVEVQVDQHFRVRRIDDRGALFAGQVHIICARQVDGGATAFELCLEAKRDVEVGVLFEQVRASRRSEFLSAVTWVERDGVPGDGRL
jgi:hypothetical protein